MTKKYRVVFFGLIGSEEAFRDRMSTLGVSSPTVDEIIEKAPVILKGGMTLKDAGHYADAVQLSGGEVNIQEYGLIEEPGRTNKSLNIQPLESFVMCPECGYKQLKEKACVKCGYVFKRVGIGRE